MRVKLSDLVNFNGTITTPAELLDNGTAYVERVDSFYAPRSKNGFRPAYFVTIPDPNDPDVKSGWEISKYAYQSRADKGQDKL